MTRKYDLVLFGATGFTAKFIISEICLNARWKSGFKWAIAGRNRHALIALSQIISAARGSIQGPLPEIIVADLKDEESLVKMTQSTKLLLNCVGPYLYLGGPIVKACIDGRCHYMDLCGEPQFIENMVLEYYQAALDSGVTIIHAAAYDSVPCDLAVLQTKRLLQSQGLTPISIEMFFSLHTSGNLGFGMHYATYLAAIQGFSTANIGLRSTRQKLAKMLPKPSPPGPPLPRAKKGLLGVGSDRRVMGWVIPYFFSDPAVVRLSQSLSLFQSLSSQTPKTPPVHFAAYITIPSVIPLLIALFYFTLFQFLVMREWGRKVLLKYPKLFTYGIASREGPSAVQIEQTSWRQTYYGTGLNPTTSTTKTIRTRMTGPEPGYAATPVIFVICVQTFFDAEEGSDGKIPRGVVTPAIAFEECDVLERLNKDGRVRWSVLDT